MADKTIGALPSAPAIYNDTLFVAEQQGKAVKVTGMQLRSLPGNNTNGTTNNEGASWGFIEMETSVPVEYRVNNTLYGLILKTYS